MGIVFTSAARGRGRFSTRLDSAASLGRDIGARRRAAIGSSTANQVATSPANNRELGTQASMVVLAWPTVTSDSVAIMATRRGRWRLWPVGAGDCSKWSLRVPPDGRPHR
ncbi:hypothetical protein GCM10023321_18150 [Pseudonocardia eucalypti]|uniref:Uncharacterized protein n=1 Tax=Pseudonocardia eucalypti TaxID=648755 RepID=A0ABP9PSA5_9PSEU